MKGKSCNKQNKADRHIIISLVFLLVCKNLFRNINAGNKNVKKAAFLEAALKISEVFYLAMISFWVIVVFPLR